MNKYNNGKIYKIISYNTDIIYIGSCCMDLRKRFHSHKNSSNSCSSKILIEKGGCDIILIEKHSCNDKEELLMKEQYWMDYYKNKGFKLINKQRAYVSELDNKESAKDYNKLYYQKHKEKLLNRINKEYKENPQKYRDLSIKKYQKNKQYYSYDTNRDDSLWRSKKRLLLVCEFIDILNSY